MTRSSRSAFVFASAALLSGCMASGSPPELAGAQPALEKRVTLARTVVTPDAVTSIPELYARAMELVRSAAYQEAAAEFDRIVVLDPDGDLVDEALFQAAAAYDEAGEFSQSAARYETLAQRFPKSPLSLLAMVRATRLLSHLESWERAGLLSQRLLASRDKLGPFELVATYAASALWRLSEDDERAAATFVELGRQLIDTHQLDAAGRVPRDLAALYYALGELRRRRADRILFDPMPVDFAAQLERRCQLLLDAQSAYSDTMRAYDAHWSAMAGFRVGQLYHRLHEDLMLVKPPASADTESKRQLFEGAMRLRYSILLGKALGMVEHTLGMAERTGQRSAWVPRLLESRASLKQAVQREQQALERLPHSRATLEAALADLTRRIEEKQQKGQGQGAEFRPQAAP